MSERWTQNDRRRWGSIWLIAAALLVAVFGTTSAVSGNWRFLFFASPLIVYGLATFLATRVHL